MHGGGRAETRRHAPPSPAAQRRLRGPLLALCAALVAALLAPLTPATAATPAAAPKAPACKPGEVAVRTAATKPRRGRKARKAVARCRALPGLTGAAAAQADTATAARKLLATPAQLRATLPRRLRGRFPLATLQRLDRAFAKGRAAQQQARAAAFTPLAQPAAPRARAAAAAPAAGGCAGVPAKDSGTASRVVDGVTVSGSQTEWGSRTGASTGSVLTAGASIAGGRIAMTERECLSWDTCPDASGTVRGHHEWTFTFVQEATKDGLSATLRTEASSTMELTGHVGGDGRVTTFDWKGEGSGTVRGEARKDGKLVSYVPGATVRATTEQSGIDPRRPGAAPQPVKLGAWGVNGALLDAARGAQIKLAGLIAGHQAGAAVTDGARSLLNAEHVWYDEAACLTVDFTPQGQEIGPGERLPVTFRVKAKDGTEVVSRYDLTPVDGAVGPPTGTTAANVVYTAPGQIPEGPFATFKVVAVSSRGRALGTHTATGRKPAKRWFRVTFTGAATYHRYEPRGIPYPQLWSDMELQFTSTMQPARFPGYAPAGQVGYWGSASVALTGRLNGRRLDGGGTRTCAGTPDATGQIGRLEVKEAGDGFDLAVVPFFLVGAVDASACGTFDDTLLWNDGVADAMTADLHVTKAELASRDVLEVPVTPKRPLTPCDGGAVNGDFACTHAVDWSGVVRLERVDAPADVPAE